MKKNEEQILLTTNDYELILSNLRNSAGKHKLSRQEAEELEGELKKARLVSKNDIPEDVVCLNSVVSVKEIKAAKTMEVMIVTPEKADIKLRKISIMSPLGTALIGYRKGNKVSWNVPSGRKTFLIVDVNNDNAALS